MKISCFCLALFTILPVLSSCNGVKKTSLSVYYFNSFCNITLYNSSFEYVYEINNILSYYDNLFSAYHTSNNDELNLYDINNSNVPVIVNDDLYNIIKTAEQFKNSNFNILSFNLNELYKNAYLKNILPLQEDVDKALLEIKNSSIVFNNEENSIYIDGDANIDLGSISKGYVLNKVYEYLKENDIKYYLIDLGSSSIALSTKPDGSSFRVGLRDIPLTYFSCSDCFLSTSSIFEQGVEINGTIYSHLINPTTGNAVAFYDLVCIQNDNPIIGDILSTTISLCYDIGQIENYIETYNLEVLASKNNQLIHFTDGFGGI